MAQQIRVTEAGRSLLKTIVRNNDLMPNSKYCKAEPLLCALRAPLPNQVNIALYQSSYLEVRLLAIPPKAHKNKSIEKLILPPPPGDPETAGVTGTDSTAVSD